MDYRYLAATWDRNTTYEYILLQAETNNNNGKASPTADEALRRKLGGSNVTVIFHTSPKTGEFAPPFLYGSALISGNAWIHPGGETK